MREIVNENTFQTHNHKEQTMQPRHIRSTTIARPVAPPARAAERPVEKPVEFILNLPGAKSATVAGSFNGWDVKRTPLSKDGNGGWKATVWLPPGRYEYKFVIDGAQWYTDPGAKE